jgi:CheY-like chemotaxis protein
MDILILEADKERHKAFLKSLVGANVVIVETAREAITKLIESSWDYLFLDHDLGGQTMVASGKNTGYEVAEWIEQNPECHPQNIIIHSFNPTGALKMQQALPKAKLRPGCWDHFPLNFVSNYKSGVKGIL